MNADGTLYVRGQETFFELEPVAWGGWDRINEGEALRFQLVVSDDVHQERKTNWLDCCYGDTVTITLTGSAEQGYTIEKKD